MIFGGVQLFMSQLPNLDSAAWASLVGMLMSFGYSFLCLGMSIYQLATGELDGLPAWHTHKSTAGSGADGCPASGFCVSQMAFRTPAWQGTP